MNRVQVGMIIRANAGPVEALGELCTSENGNWVNTGPVEDLGGLCTSENGKLGKYWTSHFPVCKIRNSSRITGFYYNWTSSCM